jgi:hypothetical protein
VNSAALQFVYIIGMNTRKLAKVDALMNQLIFAFVKRGMTHKQAKQEAFRILKSKRILKTEDD